MQKERPLLSTITGEGNNSFVEKLSPWHMG